MVAGADQDLLVSSCQHLPTGSFLKGSFLLSWAQPPLLLAGGKHKWKPRNELPGPADSPRPGQWSSPIPSLPSLSLIHLLFWSHLSLPLNTKPTSSLVIPHYGHCFYQLKPPIVSGLWQCTSSPLPASSPALWLRLRAPALLVLSQRLCSSPSLRLISLLSQLLSLFLVFPTHLVLTFPSHLCLVFPLL